MRESILLNSSVNNPPTFAVTVDSLKQGVVDIQHEFDELHEKIVATTKPDGATFENTVVPLALLENRLDMYGQRAQLLAAVSDNKSIRTAASETLGDVIKIYKGRFNRQDIFARVENVHRQLQAGGENPEHKKLTEKWYNAYIDGGCKLGSKERQDLALINEDIPKYSKEFRQMLVESTEALFFTWEELSGLPPGTLDGLEEGSGVNNGKLRVPIRDSMVKTVMSHVHDAAVRKAVFEQSDVSIASSLLPFVNVMRNRQDKAKLLGFDSFSSYCLSRKMAHDPETVELFLERLRVELTPLALQELRELKELKRSNLELTDASLDEYYLWDQPYYHELQLKQRHKVDNQQIAEYFPLKPALTGMLQIFEDVFGVTFHEVDDSVRPRLAANPKELTWHDDVLMFTVWEQQDSEPEDGSTGFIGYLYADVFARDGKPPGNANYNIHPGFSDADGKRHPVATALVMTFPPSSPTKPVLLQHRQVITMFHELGHAMHDLLSRTEFSNVHGHRAPFDWVEMPSQMLENWCWQEEELSKISKHYSYVSPEYAEAWRSEHPGEDLPPERLPADLAAKLTSTRSVNLALSSLRQIHFAKFDMYAHGKQHISESELKRWFHENRETIGLIRSSDAVHPSIGHSFVTTTHFIDASASNYYSYLFSQVYSSDIFHAAFKRDPRNKEVGRRYRRIILEPGGTYDPMDMMRDFLGREPENEAFYHDIGLGQVEK